MGFQSFQSKITDNKKLTRSLSGRVIRLVVIGAASMSLTACTIGKSWSESLAEGRAAMKAGNYDVAEKSYEAAIKAAQTKYGQNAGQTATCMTEMANMYVGQSEYRKAALVLKELLPIYSKIEPGSEDELRTKQIYDDVKKKIKNYKLEPIEEDAAKPDGTKADGAKTDGAKPEDAAKKDGSKDGKEKESSTK